MICYKSFSYVPLAVTPLLLIRHLCSYINRAFKPIVHLQHSCCYATCAVTSLLKLHQLIVMLQHQRKYTSHMHETAMFRYCVYCIFIRHSYECTDYTTREILCVYSVKVFLLLHYFMTRSITSLILLRSSREKIHNA